MTKQIRSIFLEACSKIAKLLQDDVFKVFRKWSDQVIC